MTAGKGKSLSGAGLRTMSMQAVVRSARVKTSPTRYLRPASELARLVKTRSSVLLACCWKSDPADYAESVAVRVQMGSNRAFVGLPATFFVLVPTRPHRWAYTADGRASAFSPSC